MKIILFQKNEISLKDVIEIFEIYGIEIKYNRPQNVYGIVQEKQMKENQQNNRIFPDIQCLEPF
jgi:hypothetical protein